MKLIFMSITLKISKRTSKIVGRKVFLQKFDPSKNLDSK